MRARVIRRCAPGFGERSAVRAHLVGALRVDVRVAGLHEPLGHLVEPVEIVAGEVQVVFVLVAPFEAEPVHGFDDRVNVLLLFLLGVRVVEAQVAAPAVFRGEAEVQADRLRVADVQVAVGLGGEARADGRGVDGGAALQGERAGAAGPGAAGMLARAQILFDDCADEVARG